MAELYLGLRSFTLRTFHLSSWNLDSPNMDRRTWNLYLLSCYGIFNVNFIVSPAFGRVAEWPLGPAWILNCARDMSRTWHKLTFFFGRGLISAGWSDPVVGDSRKKSRLRRLVCTSEWVIDWLKASRHLSRLIAHVEWRRLLRLLRLLRRWLRWHGCRGCLTLLCWWTQTRPFIQILSGCAFNISDPPTVSLRKRCMLGIKLP